MQTPNRSKVRASGRDVLGCPRYERCRIIVLVLRTSAQLRFPRFFVAGGVSRGDARASGRLPLGLDASTLRASRGLLALAARREYTERSDRHHRCRVLPGHHEHSPGDRPTLGRADSIGDGFSDTGCDLLAPLRESIPIVLGSGARDRGHGASSWTAGRRTRWRRRWRRCACANFTSRLPTQP